MIVRFHGLGAASFVDEKRDCPADSGWKESPKIHEAWCSCMFERGSDHWKRCNIRFKAIEWTDINPNRSHSSNPGVLAAPWTEAGAGTRGIPRRGETTVLQTTVQATTDIVAGKSPGTARCPGKGDKWYDWCTVEGGAKRKYMGG